jgi:hypothetical protein
MNKLVDDFARPLGGRILDGLGRIDVEDDGLQLIL